MSQSRTANAMAEAAADAAVSLTVNRPAPPAPPMPTADTEVELFSLAGRDGYLREVNESFARLLGRTAAEVSQTSLLELIHPDDIPQTLEGIAALERGDPEVLFENRFLQPDDTTVWLQWVARPMAGTEEWWATGRDISEFRRLLAGAVDQAARLHVAVGGTSAGSWELDARTGRLKIDTTMAAMLSLGGATDLSIDDLVAVVDEQERAPLEAAFDLVQTDRSSAAIDMALQVGEAASLRHLSLRGRTVEHDRRGRPIRVVGVIIDVTDQKAMEEHLMRLVMSDPLTGLANRRAFDQGLRTELRRAVRGKYALSLLMIDIDHFKKFNDTYGHLVGDDVLCVVSRAITGAVLRPADLVSRFGGEEFAVVLPDTEEGPAGEIATRLLDAVRALHLRQAPEAHITVSIGSVTTSPGDAPIKGAPLLALADAALYRAKEAGRDRWVSAQ